MRVLAEGAQGSMLDVDFGTFPFVTSSNTISAGVCSGLGIAPQKIKEIIGITKAYCTRVGSGPFPTELFDEKGEFLRKTGNEFGSTTGRPRRCGWIDLVALNFACMINGVTQIVMTKADIMDELDTLEVCKGYLVNGVESMQVPLNNGNDHFPKLLIPSVALSVVVGSAPLPRTEVVSKLWIYIKKHNLQDQINKRNINTDSNLRAIFGKPQVTMFELASLINKHLK
jgi:hypothetical protein